VIVVGSPEDESLEERLRDRAASASGRIRFLDPAIGAEKGEHLARAAVLLFPPIEPEGHPRVVLEAVAAGLPVVATDRGAIADTVDHGVNGYVLPDADPEALADRVIEILQDDELRRNMGEASQRIHAERFTQPRADERMAEWLTNVSGQRLGARARLSAALDALESWGSERDWRGSDPYEGLNAWRPAYAMRRPITRRLLMQAVKRSPIDLRAALGIPPRHNAVALAQVVSSYSRAKLMPPDQSEASMRRALDQLIAIRSADYATPCWGYHFDVETRAFFYPKTMPNTIATAFAGHALLDAHTRTGDQQALELAQGVGQFFLDHVGQTPGRGGSFFGYFVGDRSPIHNANMLACGFLARLSQAVSRPDLQGPIRDGVGFALAHQRPDGSWPYAEAPNLGWIDGFHTGYILDSLFYCASAIDEAIWWTSFEHGLRFYRERLFLPEGTAKYYAEKTYPLDIQSNAQGIRTLALAATRDPSCLEQATRVLDYTLDHMRRSDGAFLFQRRRFWANRTPHIRWAQAPMFEAMTLLDQALATDA
jgi:hypothetical protein